MAKRLLCVLALTFVLVGSVYGAGDAPPTWYVSPKGNDAWSGKLESPNGEGTDGPLATLAQAVVVARKAGAGPRRIVLLPGEHAVTKTIELINAS